MPSIQNSSKWTERIKYPANHFVLALMISQSIDPAIPANIFSRIGCRALRYRLLQPSALSPVARLCTAFQLFSIRSLLIHLHINIFPYMPSSSCCLVSMATILFTISLCFCMHCYHCCCLLCIVDMLPVTLIAIVPCQSALILFR